MNKTHVHLVLGVALIACFFMVSLPFETGYSRYLQEMAHNPGIRFLAGILLLVLAHTEPVLGALAFLVLFLWIADIHLLSSVSFVKSS